MFPTDPTLGAHYVGPPAGAGRSTVDDVLAEWQNAAKCQRRSHEFRWSSFDPETMTVEAVVMTRTPVQRRDRHGPYGEILNPHTADRARMKGAPVLDNHKSGSARNVIGVVQDTWIEGDLLVARLRLSQADDVAPIIARIQDGTLTGVSVGYQVPEWRDFTGSDGTRFKESVRSTVHEVSVVPFPADPNARIRNIAHERSITVSEGTVIETPPPDQAEGQRRSDIRTLVRAAGLPAETADDLIDSGADLTAAKAAVYDAQVARRRSQPIIRTQTPAGDDPAVMLRHRQEALLARMTGEAPTEGARRYLGDTLRDHARAMLDVRGISHRGMDPVTEVRTAMHSASDFPQFLTSTGNRMLANAYEAASSPIRTRLSRPTTHTDFRNVTKLKLSDVGQLAKVAETGEITSTTRGEAGESYAVESYASLFALSEKAIVNDDLGAFRDWSRTAGRMAAETEATVITANLTQGAGAGPVLGEDGKRLFHADHGNLAAAGSALDVDGIAAARLALRRQKSIDGKTPINIPPAFILVAPEQETAAEKALAAIYAATPDHANPFSGKLSVLVEPRLSGGAWYVFADPATLPVLEHAYLAGQAGPQMASRAGWEVLGMEFRVVLHFGCAAVDWRGAYRNPGV